jgi:hypothetical protein
MTPAKGINPSNPQQARIFFDMFAAQDAGDNRHPQVIIKEVAARLGFSVLGSVPQSMFDGWDVWIEFSEAAPDVGPFFRDVPWRSVGSV